MNNVQIKILTNPQTLKDLEKKMVFGARLTQHGHQIHNLDDAIALYNRDYTSGLVDKLITLPHPTLQKFGTIEVLIVGCSRRFLAQITRHQNEVKFMSSSLQYSDYTVDDVDSMTDSEICDMFFVPEPLKKGSINWFEYLEDCKRILKIYCRYAKIIGNDAAGYLMPQALRGTLLISATPYQWKHMIEQRTCRRNTSETRDIMQRIGVLLCQLSPIFGKEIGPACTKGPCPEGDMSCKNDSDK